MHFLNLEFKRLFKKQILLNFNVFYFNLQSFKFKSFAKTFKAQKITLLRRKKFRNLSKTL